MTRISKWIAWAAVAALSVAVGNSPTYAQDTTAPPEAVPLKAGDRFIFKVGPVTDVHKVLAVGTKTATLESKVYGIITMPLSISGAWSWTGGDFTFGTQETIDGEPPSLMPLEVGKKVQVNGKTKTPRSESYFVKTCTVLERIPMTVPAGTFDTFRIQCSYRVIGGEPVIRTYYYAPQLGYWAAYQVAALSQLVRYVKVK